MNRIEWPILSHSDPIQFSQVPPLQFIQCTKLLLVKQKRTSSFTVSSPQALLLLPPPCQRCSLPSSREHRSLPTSINGWTAASVLCFSAHTNLQSPLPSFLAPLFLAQLLQPRTRGQRFEEGGIAVEKAAAREGG